MTLAWDEAKIRENMRQREICDYVYQFVLETIEAEAFKDPERFAKLVVDRIQEKWIREPGVDGSVMTELESKMFGRRSMPFGEFVGVPIDDVPLDRLQWYADQEFVDNLRRYLKTARIRQEQAREEQFRADQF